jgi:serine/threonine protein kinase
VLFEFLIGKKPFALPDPSDSNFHAIAVEGNLKGLLMMKGISLDEEACDLLQKMLQSDPSKRLTLADVVSHPWVSRGYKESKPKQVLSTVEETRNCWFIQNNAIDDNDLDEYNLAHRLRINSCSSGDGGDEVTADSTDEESRNPRGSTQSIPYNISDEQLSVDLNNQNSNAASGAMQHAQGGTIEDEMLEQICTQQQKKKKGISSFLKKPAKLWKNHTKKTSTLTTIVSGVSSYDSDDTTSKTEMKMRGDGRLC